MPVTTRRRGSFLLALLLALPAARPAVALDLTLPAGAQPAGAAAAPASVRLPVGPAVDGRTETVELSGQVAERGFTVPGIEATLPLMEGFRAQLAEGGWQVLLDCADETCGGFDFRFALQVLPEPQMHVDLGDFRYLAARRGDEWVAVLVSRRDTTGHVQITTVAPAPGTGTPEGSAPPPEPGLPLAPAPALPAAGSLGQRLEGQGHVVLSDLDFATGSADLGPGPHASLEELSAWLKENPARRIALVGHTDATGGLEVNIAVSRQRARSVLERLAGSYGVPRGQMEAQGVGYLSPRLSNLTEEGRAANRRVEAVLLSTE